jgi:DNA-binding protein Fis
MSADARVSKHPGIAGDVEAAALRSEVEALLNRYFAALDGRDFATLRDCFAADATAHYDRPLKGTAAIMTHLREAMSRCAASTHIGGGPVIFNAGGGLTVESPALALLVVEAPDGTIIRVRGLRYRDLLVRSSRGLVFQRRERRAEWTFDASGRRLPGRLGLPEPLVTEAAPGEDSSPIDAHEKEAT